jgi:predicted nucleotidyltransferase
MRARIGAELENIAAEEGVTLLLAIESGSRAWGFHSPDSDYDVRFIYAQPVDWHLTVASGRDVIERPISDELDLSGWDLRKTLGLVLGSNAVVQEWLSSPITYVEVPRFRQEMQSFAAETLRTKPMMWHYLRLAQRQMDRLRNPDGQARLKRYFYIVRPVLTLRWMRLNGTAAAPMNMDDLIAGCELDSPTLDQINTLTQKKKSMREIGTVTDTPAVIDALIRDELDRAQTQLGDSPPEPRQAHRGAADELLRRWTRACDPTIVEAS